MLPTLDHPESTLIVYFDLPKNEIQYRSRAKSIKNFASNSFLTDKESYKRFYFVDWPVLNKHKCKILPKIDIFVDEQQFNNPVWMKGKDFRSSLNKLNESIIRVRPWFEPGIWGGEWMKRNIPNIEMNTVNYAWSFELIAPENGIILCDEKRLIEVSFDFLMYSDNKALMGQICAEKFGHEFPLRFDFLDTFNGDNLSIQCHAGKEYLKANFGETMPQDESYYILDAQEDSRVYLGFQVYIKKLFF